MVAWWDQHSLILAWVASLTFMVLMIVVLASVGCDRDAAHGRERQRRCQQWCPVPVYSILAIPFGAPLLMKFGFGYDWELIALFYIGIFLVLVCVGGCTHLLGLE